MKILILNTELSGINKFVFKELEKKGYELFVEKIPLPKILKWIAMLQTFCFDYRKWRQKFDYKINKLHKSSWCFTWRTKYCNKLLNRYKDRVDLVMQISGMFMPSLTKIKIPYVIFADYTMTLALKYEPWSPQKEEIDKWLYLERQLYQKASAVFVCSENTRISLINDYEVPKNKVFNVRYGVPFDQVENYEKTFDKKIVLFVGADFQRKGGDALLKAFEKVHIEIPDTNLLIIGPSKKLYKIEQDGVTFLGPVYDRMVLKECFRQAYVFVMPSVCEPFGLVFLEAMSYKLPCIGSNVDATPEIIKDGETGFLVEKNNVGMLTDRLIQILTDKNKALHMGLAGFEHFKKSFKWEKVGESIDDVIHQILQKEFKNNE
jgi:glycosyltransferase involved in cell wall biosynthesis